MSHSQPDLLSASDEELLSYFKNGQNEALVALLTRRKTWLWNVAKKSIRDRSLAEDALQEALVSIWKNAHTFRGESQVSSWLYQIRSHVSLTDLEQFDDIGGSSTFENATIDSLLVHGALLELEPQHREVINLIDLEGHSVQEVSELLGIPIGTVKSRASRGREALRQILLKIIETNGNQTRDTNVIPLGVKNAKPR